MNSYEDKIILLILDGWGISTTYLGNAIKLANPENFNRLWSKYFNRTLQTFDPSFDIKYRETSSKICNSTISAGRFIKPDKMVVDESIANGSFENNPAILEAFENSRTNGSSLHFVGSISESNQSLLFSFIDLAKSKNFNRLYIHAVIDDNKDYDNYQKVLKSLTEIDESGIASIATVIGANQIIRSKSNLKIASTIYNALVSGAGKIQLEPKQIIKDCEEHSGELSEIQPTIIAESGSPIGKINDLDSIFFFDINQSFYSGLLDLFISRGKLPFNLRKLFNIKLFSLLEGPYPESVKASFKTAEITPNLAQILSDRKISQLHISETRKKDNVGKFFDGFRNEPYFGEDHIYIKSEEIGGQFGNPGFGLKTISKIIKENVESKKYRFILANITNADIQAHKGNFKKVIESIKAIDEEIGALEKIALENDFALIIAGDHGNAESMNVSYNTLDSAPSHNLNPVPLIICSSNYIQNSWKKNLQTNTLHEIISSRNSIQDIAPTILDLFHIEKPDQMEGTSLIRKDAYEHI